MRIVSESTLVDGLTEWGQHEVMGRHGIEAGFDANDPKACLNHLLWYRSPAIARVLDRVPLKTFVVDFEHKDSQSMVLADGRTMKQWIDDARRSNGAELEYFNQLVNDGSLHSGRLFCVSQMRRNQPLQIGRLTVYDGWHRAAAWLERCNKGLVSMLRSYLVITRNEDRYLPHQ